MSAEGAGLSGGQPQDLQSPKDNVMRRLLSTKLSSVFVCVGCLTVVGISARNHVVGLERIENLADRQFQDRERGVGALGKRFAEPDQGIRQLFQCCQGVAQHGAEI
jgi:hypothetical protein